MNLAVTVQGNHAVLTNDWTYIHAVPQTVDAVSKNKLCHLLKENGAAAAPKTIFLCFRFEAWCGTARDPECRAAAYARTREREPTAMLWWPLGLGGQQHASPAPSVGYVRVTSLALTDLFLLQLW